MNKKKPNIKYVGKVLVSITGISGLIHPNQTLYLPEEKVRNLVLDKNWKLLDEPEPSNPPKPETKKEKPKKKKKKEVNDGK